MQPPPNDDLEPESPELDPFLAQSRSSRPIFIATGLAVAVVLGFIGVRIAQNGMGYAEMEYQPAIDRSALDVGPPVRAEAPPTVPAMVTSEPDGAWIVVNGIATRLQTPAEVELVQNATNTVALYLDGYQSHVQNLQVGATAEAVAVPLVAITAPEGWRPPPPVEGQPPVTAWSLPMGKVRVVSRTPGGEVEGAEVLINGELQEGTTPLEVEVPAGQEQHVTVRLPGHRNSVATVTAIPWQDMTDTREVIVELTADREQANIYTTLRIDTTPAGATVLLNGEDQQGARLLSLDTLQHYTVRIEAPDHEPYERSFDATAGIIELNAVLTPIRTGPTQLSLQVEPEGTIIYAQSLRHGTAGANQLGTTAISGYELEAGDYQITLSHRSEAGRQRARFDITLEPGVHHQLTYRLEGETATLVDSRQQPLP